MRPFGNDVLKNDAAILDRPKWDAVFLVCRDCGKRSRAPKEAKPKKLVGALRSLAKHERPRPRVLLTSCLGLCPKAATAIAFVANDRPPRIVAVAREDQLAAWTGSLLQPVDPQAD